MIRHAQSESVDNEPPTTNKAGNLAKGVEPGLHAESDPKDADTVLVDWPDQSDRSSRLRFRHLLILDDVPAQRQYV